MSYDGVRGMGVLYTARELAARMIAMRAFGSSVFKNSARPSVVIKMQTPFKNEATQERFIQSWQRMYSGTENAHKTAVRVYLREHNAELATG
jgi:phage portal protein BeeE